MLETYSVILIDRLTYSFPLKVVKYILHSVKVGRTQILQSLAVVEHSLNSLQVVEHILRSICVKYFPYSK
jgi:hypothetical protein